MAIRCEAAAEGAGNKKVLIVGDTVSTTFGEALACGLAAYGIVDARVDTFHDLKVRMFVAKGEIR